jgi:hypothetical protein
MVRNPIEMVVSLHGHHICDGGDDVEDLEAAWKL